jgi:glycine/D-amino acid oxidase-like deaminating enzyme
MAKCMVQVHPAKLTTALMTAAEQSVGSELLIGTVIGIKVDQSNRVSAVQVQQGEQLGAVELPADAVVLAMGPWTGSAQAWLPTVPATSGQKYHSIVLRPQQPASDACLFTSFKTADGRSIEPEVYPRPDGSVYVCGEPQALPVPSEGPAAVDVDPKRCQVLQVRLAGGCNSCWTANRINAALRKYVRIQSSKHDIRCVSSGWCVSCLLRS